MKYRNNVKKAIIPSEVRFSHLLTYRVEGWLKTAGLAVVVVSIMAGVSAGMIRIFGAFILPSLYGSLVNAAESVVSTVMSGLLCYAVGEILRLMKTRLKGIPGDRAAFPLIRGSVLALVCAAGAFVATTIYALMQAFGYASTPWDNFLVPRAIAVTDQFLKLVELVMATASTGLILLGLAQAVYLLTRPVGGAYRKS